MQADIDRFAAFNAQILAISTETQEQGRELKSSRGLTFPILSDPQAQAINQYAGRDQDTGRAHPATFVVDSNGRVAWAHLSEGSVLRPENEEILAELEKLLSP